jgi:hypothetical protein
MENPSDEEIIIPVCILLVAVGIQQNRRICLGEYGRDHG